MKGVLKKNAPYLERLIGSNPKTQDDLKKAFSTVRQFQKMKDLEKVTQTKIPYLTLLKVASNGNLKAKDEDKLKTWIQKINQLAKTKLPSFKGPVENSYGKVRFLHRVLRDTVSLFNENLPKTTKKAEVGRLELELLQRGCTFFKHADPTQVTWCNQLVPGSVVSVKGVDYRIENVLQKDERNREAPTIFSVEGHPDLELVVERNGAIGHIKDHLEHLEHCGIFRQQLIGIEEYGRAALYERVYHPLNKTPWASTTFTFDERHDGPFAVPIVDLLQGLIQMPFTPHPLAPESFGFTSKNEMRARHLLLPARKSFDALEQFAFKCSYDGEGNFHPKVFQYLMQQSGLQKMPQAQVYQRAVKASLDNKRTETESEQSAALYQSIHIIKNRLLGELLRRSYKQANQLQKQISQVIANTYRCYGGGILPNDFYDQCFAQLR